MRPHRQHHGAEILASIRQELFRLLNTRCVETIDALGGQERTIVNYGMPDFLSLNPTRSGDRERLARLIADAVRAYEPRLRHPHVSVAPDAEEPRALRVVLEGTLALDNLLEPVSFPLLVQHRGGAIDIQPA